MGLHLTGSSLTQLNNAIVASVPPDLATTADFAVREAQTVPAFVPSVQNSLLNDGRVRTTLLDGQASQSYVLGSCTKTDDTTRIAEGAQSKRFTTTGAVTATAYVDPVFPSPAADPLTFAPASTVVGRFWVDDPSKVTSITVEIYSDSGATVKWSNSVVSSALTRGWNTVRWQAIAGTLTGWGSVYRVRIVAATSAATSFNVGALWVESPAKAQILFIADRGYKSFKDNALPDMRSRGLPVTWAMDPALNGSNVGTAAEACVDADFATFYAAGDDLSVHSYDGTVTSSKTGPQIVEDALRALKWLYDRSYFRGHRWRAAWVQNAATNAAAAKHLFAAYATPTSNAAITCWPFPDGQRYNVPRTSLQGRSTAEIDATFATLQATNGLFVCYTHGINVAGGNDMTPTEWAYFMSKVDAGIAGGWLEFVTFSQLAAAQPVQAGSVSYSSPSNSAQTTQYTTAQTDTVYAIPTNAKKLRIRLNAGAGGGGSGRRGAAASIRCGGGGGSPGGYAEWELAVADLAVSTLYVTVGAGGAGGAAVTANDTSGNAGGAGGVSYVKNANATIALGNSLAYAQGGSGGAGGTATTGTGGSASVGRWITGAGAAASTTGAAGSAAGGVSSSAGAGGSGGGITSADAHNAGGNGAYAPGFYVVSAAAGTAGGGAGGAGGNPPDLGYGGGGAGGGGNTGGAGGDGGAGGRGAGGGGGGAALNGNNSGKGGDGGIGFVEITAYF